MRGQNARSGPSTRPGFEGGQTPLYRRMPKLKGIAGGMSAGLPSHVTVSLDTIAEKFGEGEEVSLSSLVAKSVLNLTGRERKLGLKVLGDGELSAPVTITAESFSTAAQAKIAAAGGSMLVVPGREKWTRAAHEASGKKPAAKRKTGRPKNRIPDDQPNPGKTASKKGRAPREQARRAKRQVAFVQAKAREAAAKRKEQLIANGYPQLAK